MAADIPVPPQKDEKSKTPKEVTLAFIQSCTKDELAEINRTIVNRHVLEMIGKMDDKYGPPPGKTAQGSTQPKSFGTFRAFRQSATKLLKPFCFSSGNSQPTVVFTVDSGDGSMHIRIDDKYNLPFYVEATFSRKHRTDVATNKMAVSVSANGGSRVNGLTTYPMRCIATLTDSGLTVRDTNNSFWNVTVPMVDIPAIV